MNPTLDPSVVERALKTIRCPRPASICAEFRTDIADFISRAVVEACVDPNVYERPYLRSRRYLAFIDASGGSGSDSMTLAIAHAEDVFRRLMQSASRPPFSPDAVVAEFSALLKTYHVSRAESDKWGGDWVGEAFRKNGNYRRAECEAKERSLRRNAAVT